jgi:hypothetical protein
MAVIYIDSWKDSYLGSGYPSESMIVIGLSLPIPRQRWCCLMKDVSWLPEECCNGLTGSKYLECNASIRTENTLNNRTRALNWTKEDRANKSWTIKLAIDNTSTEWSSVLRKGWIVTVEYLQGLNIFVITELIIATLFYWCVSSWGISSSAAKFYFLPVGSLVALWKNHRTPQHPMWPHA